MLATKKQRAGYETLKKRADFLKIQNSGLKWVSHGLVIQARKKVDIDPLILRVGYTVTKKIDKSAVNRNRIKRRLRSVAADVLSLYASRDYEYILVGRSMTASREYKSLCQDVIWSLKKMDLYRAAPCPVSMQQHQGE
jgi:ribonuclease P protein component